MIKAIVRCSDGLCYPCIILERVTDYMNYSEAVYIEFTDHHPDYVNKRMITRWSKIRIGGNDEQTSNDVSTITRIV